MEAREQRLLHEQQLRISAEIGRAGGARNPVDDGAFPHKIAQGGAGAALLAVRKLSI